MERLKSCPKCVLLQQTVDNLRIALNEVARVIEAQREEIRRLEERLEPDVRNDD